MSILRRRRARPKRTISRIEFGGGRYYSQLICCQCTEAASDEAAVMKMRAYVDGEPVPFYIHAQCLSRFGAGHHG